jgi:predicted nucleotidyltransferase
MSTYPLDRQRIMAALKEATEPLDYVNAMWEGGSAAFDRLDEYSDIDIQFDVADDKVEDTFQAIQNALEQLSPIDLQYRTPSLPWPGIFQVFYRLSLAGPFLLIDSAVIQHNAPDKLLDEPLHGRAVFYFDKCGVAHIPPFDWSGLQDHLRRRVEALRTTFDLFQVMVVKEVFRQRPMDALMFYTGYTLRPLVEALRILHQPARHGFGIHYAYLDFPPEVATRLEKLYFVSNLADIEQKRAEAEDWFWQTLETIQSK